MLDASYLSNLWYFVAAARHESFSKAANEMNITQGAISQRIRQLETRLGIDLFERNGRRVVLTENGRSLLEVCNRSFGDISQEFHRMTRLGNQNCLVLICIPSFAMDWLIPRLDLWHRYSGGIRLQIRAEMREISKQFMMQHDVNLALQYDNFEYPDLHTADVGTESLIPVCTPELKNSLGDEPLDSFLGNTNLIHDAFPWEGASRAIEWSFWLTECGYQNVVSERGDFFNLTHLATKAALQGQGVAMGRLKLIGDYLKRGELVSLVDQKVASSAKYRLLSLQRFSEGTPEALFRKWIEKELEVDKIEKIAQQA